MNSGNSRGSRRVTDPSYEALYAFVSLVRAHGDSTLRAKAAVLLGEPVGSCRQCGHPLLADDDCLCHGHTVREHASHPLRTTVVTVAAPTFGPRP